MDRLEGKAFVKKFYIVRLSDNVTKFLETKRNIEYCF